MCAPVRHESVLPSLCTRLIQLACPTSHGVSLTRRHLHSLTPSLLTCSFGFKGNAAQITYISRANATRLKLIHGDGDTFSDVLTLISEYEGS